MVAYSDLQTMLMLLLALSAPFVGTARGHLQVVVDD